MNTYEAHRSQLLSEFGRVACRVADLFIARYGEEEARALLSARVRHTLCRQ